MAGRSCVRSYISSGQGLRCAFSAIVLDRVLCSRKELYKGVKQGADFCLIVLHMQERDFDTRKVPIISPAYEQSNSYIREPIR